MNAEPIARRQEPRTEIGLPVELEAGKGRTRDISASGVFFETDVPVTTGARLRFSLLLDQTQSGPLRLECEGQVVRVEDRDGKLGVAAILTSSHLIREETLTPHPARLPLRDTPSLAYRVAFKPSGTE